MGLRVRSINDTLGLTFSTKGNFLAYQFSRRYSFYQIIPLPINSNPMRILILTDPTRQIRPEDVNEYLYAIVFEPHARFNRYITYWQSITTATSSSAYYLNSRHGYPIGIPAVDVYDAQTVLSRSCSLFVAGQNLANLAIVYCSVA